MKKSFRNQYKKKDGISKLLGLFLLFIINFSTLYLLYKYVSVACSIKIDNVFHLPYEPSGMQFFYYYISFPFFVILSFLSQLHSYYFNLEKSLFPGIIIIWLFYFILITYIDEVIHFSKGNDLLYYGSLILSFFSIYYVVYVTYCQFVEFLVRLKGIMNEN